MSQGEKETVVRATQVRAKLRGDGSWLQQRKEADADTSEKKVRTKLRGDGSWLQHHTDSQAESAEEKPWMAEVRSGHLNGANAETSPVSSPSRPAPPPALSETERAPAAGYLIRGVFTQLDKPAASQTSNSFSKGPQFTKKPSESYKKIAPHTVKCTSDSQEGSLSREEQEKRAKAASSVLRKSAARQRSYVLSAAKKFESQEASGTPLDKTSPSFVARRVEITEDDDGATTPPPVASAPLPRPRKIVDTMITTAVKEPRAAKQEAAPEPVKGDSPPVPVPEKDPFEHMKPGCTKVATRLPELISESVQVVRTETKESDVSGQLVTPLVEPTTEIPALVSPAPPVPESPAPVSDPPESIAPAIAAPESALLVSLTPEAPALAPSVPESSAVTEMTVKTEPEPEAEPSPKPSSSADTLSALSDTLISFGTSSTSIKDDEPAQAEEEESLVDGRTKEDQRPEQEPTPQPSNREPETDDLLSLSDGPEAPAEPVPPSPGRWSQDLLSGLDSLGMQQEEEKQTAEGTQSNTETVTTSAKTVIVTDKSEERSADPWSSHVSTTVTESSLADPFDPYPIGTTSSNSSSDLLQPHSDDISINSASLPSTENKDPRPETNMSSNALESLADDIVPIDTAATRLGTRRSWATTWETSAAQEADADKSQDAKPEGGEQMLVMFERKSTENDSPWDRWTSPTVCTVTTAEEEEESPEDTQTQTVTTITTVRETQSEPKPALDPDETYSRTWTEEDQRVDTPPPEGKKPFVYVKYVDATELSMHNGNEGIGSGSDYLTSSSIGCSPSSPSIYSSGSLSSTCTYCGELVGNNARISIEHLNINCHPSCFKCAVCSKPMGDLLDSMFIHGGKVNCENCYVKALE